MKIYLAAMFSRVLEMCVLAERLRCLGHKVTGSMNKTTMRPA